MSRISHIRGWVTFVVFVFTLAQVFMRPESGAAQEATRAKVSDSVTAKILFAGEVSGQQVTLRYTGAYPAGQISVDLRAAVEDDILRVARETFASVEATNESVVPANVLLIELRVASVSYAARWDDTDISYSVTFNMHSSAGGRFTRTEAKRAKGTYDHSIFSKEHNMASLAKNLPQTFSASLAEAFSKFLNASDTAAFVQNETSQLGADDGSLTDLSPYYATYRVTDTEAAVRRKPNAKSVAVRKLGIGSVVSVIGQLPGGWLQVSKEGEAIGWIHTDSVKLVTEQVVGSPQPASVASASTAIDLAFWESVRNSSNPADIQAYVQKFPNGTFAGLARARLAALGEPVPARINTVPLSGSGKFDFGQYHALVIGNDNYRSVTPLKTAVADAKAVAALLRKDYGFKVTLLLDATRNQMLDAFDDLRRGLTERDNLLIYYAGHGYLDADSDRGFWMPVDADRDRRANWLSNSDLADTVRATRAKHVLVIADSCYAGTLTRSLSVELANLDDMSRLSQKRARTALTSGGLEPVEDSGGGNHSVFAKAFLDALRKNTGATDMSQIFSEMRRQVVLTSPQTPQYGDIRQTGHEGGDFIFVRRK